MRIEEMTKEQKILFAKEIIDEYMTISYPTQEEKKKIIIESVEQVSGLNLSEHSNTYKGESIVLCRQILAYLLKNYTMLSLDGIAKILRPENPFVHGTILHNIRLVENFDVSLKKSMKWILTDSIELIENKIAKKKIEYLANQIDKN